MKFKVYDEKENKYVKGYFRLDSHGHLSQVIENREYPMSDKRYAVVFHINGYELGGNK